jgi:hypothetical protein
MRTAAVVLWLTIKRTVVALSEVLMLAIKRMVLVMLWVLVLAIQRMVVLGLVKLPLYQKQILRSHWQVVCVSWCSYQHSHAERGESQIIPQFTNAEKFKQN